MRTIIAGSRSEKNYDDVLMAVQNAGWKPTLVLSGCANGADTLGEMWAQNNHIPVKHYRADWTNYGQRAGYLRNEVMAENADALIAIWDGESKGTKHMIDIARRKGLKVYVFNTSIPTLEKPYDHI